MTIEFLLTSLVVVLLPGTGVIYTVAIGLGHGFKGSAAAALGCTMGIVPAATASIVGLAAVLHASAMLYQVVKFLGVLYLFYMAWSIVREGGALSVSRDEGRENYFRIAVNGTMLNVLNPKLSLFFLAFLPQFVAVDRQDSVGALVELTAVFMLMTLLVFLVYGACASLVKDYVVSRPSVLRWMRYLFAGTFGFLGLRLALSES